MPSYGSNDGYGQQKLGDRPSVRLTATGKAQSDSSQMARLLAEQDIEREPAPSAVPPVDLNAAPGVQWFMAAKANDVPSLERLLTADPALLHSTGRGIGNSALHWAASFSATEAMRYLLNAGVDVNLRNAGESTALHTAASAGHVTVVEELLRRGADPTAKESSGETAKDMAMARGLESIVQLLAAA